MIRVVIDTNVLIRYLIRPGAAITALVSLWWLGERVQMVTSPELLAELELVLERDNIKKMIHHPEGQALLEAIRQRADLLPSLKKIPAYTRDPKDDKFVACALVGQAQYVITLDQDLLALREMGNVRMVTPQEFIALI